VFLCLPFVNEAREPVRNTLVVKVLGKNANNNKWGLQVQLRGTRFGGEWVDFRMKVDEVNCPLIDLPALSKKKDAVTDILIGKKQRHVVFIQEKPGPLVHNTFNDILVAKLKVRVVEVVNGNCAVKVDRDHGKSLSYLDFDFQGNQKQVMEGILILIMAGNNWYLTDVTFAGNPSQRIDWTNAFGRSVIKQRLLRPECWIESGFGEKVCIEWRQERQDYIVSRPQFPVR
jgi:hypothetical protein